MRKPVIALVVLAVIGMFLGLLTVPPASAQAKLLKFGILHYPEHPFAMTSFFFAERMDELTKGAVKVEVHHSKSLGDARELVEYLRLGTVDVAGISTANLSQVVKDFDMFPLPYLFKNEQHYWAVLNSDMLEGMKKKLEEKGIKLLFWMDAGARSFYTKTKPVMSPDDLKGQKIRVMASPVMIKTINVMGGSGVPLAWGELYTALQTGVVDGAENNPPSVLTEKHYEVSKYFCLDEHMRIPDTVLMSMRTWNRLSPKEKELFEKASLEGQAFMRGSWKAFTEAALTRLKAGLIEVRYPKKEPFMQAVRGFVLEEARNLGVEDSVRKILELAKNY